MNWTEYDSNTGRIGGIHSGYSTANAALSQVFWQGMDAVVEGEYDNRDFYILNGEVTERPASPVTINGLNLSGIPTGSTLWIDGERYEAEGGVELEFPLPGSYSLRVECWPYKDWEGEVGVPVVSGVEA
jgi:hypothetical protein